MPALNNRPESDQAVATRRGPKQSELFAKFSHLDRQREAVQLATRILRLVACADSETAEIAMEIAGTAVRMKFADPGLLNKVPHPLDAGIPCPTQA